MVECIVFQQLLASFEILGGAKVSFVYIFFLFSFLLCLIYLFIYLFLELE